MLDRNKSFLESLINLLVCTSEYPADFNSLNLNLIPYLKNLNQYKDYKKIFSTWFDFPKEILSKEYSNYKLVYFSEYPELKGPQNLNL